MSRKVVIPPNNKDDVLNGASSLLYNHTIKLLSGLFGLHGGLDQEPDDGDVGSEAEELTPGADGPFATGDDPIDACEGEACADYAHEGSTSDEA